MTPASNHNVSNKPDCSDVKSKKAVEQLPMAGDQRETITTDASHSSVAARVEGWRAVDDRCGWRLAHQLSTRGQRKAIVIR